jgi:DNA-binding transcriptional MerR regulator
MSSRRKKSPSAFRTISEVADELGVQQHVLRFWETKFTQVKPLKRGGGRRYYRPEDVELLKTIHNLLYVEGYTIKGVQKLLKGQGKQQIISGDLGSPANQTVQRTSESGGMSDKQRSILEAMLGDLKDLRNMLKGQE